MVSIEGTAMAGAAMEGHSGGSSRKASASWSIHNRNGRHCFVTKYENEKKPLNLCCLFQRANLPLFLAKWRSLARDHWTWQPCGAEGRREGGRYNMQSFSIIVQKTRKYC